VGIAAGGGNSWGIDASYRRWESGNFAYVAKRLTDNNDLRVLVFGPSEEKDICDNIHSIVGEKAMSLCGATSLGRLVEFMGRCELVICNEGGPLHLAVSQDVKTISIFGPVDDKVYGPYPVSEKHKVIKAEGVECRPCYANFKHKSCSDHKCLSAIAKDTVLNMAKESLGLKDR
jgi:heptosyltransferase-2